MSLSCSGKCIYLALNIINQQFSETDTSVPHANMTNVIGIAVWQIMQTALTAWIVGCMAYNASIEPGVSHCRTAAAADAP